MKCFKNKPVNDSIYFSGCPYHIIHNGAQKGGEVFACKSKFDTEYMMIDQYHWFVYQAKKNCYLSVNLGLMASVRTHG